MRVRAILMLSVLAGWLVYTPVAAEQMLERGLVHVRSSPEREWSEFPEKAEQPKFFVRFEAKRNETEHTLRLRQQDVKQAWRVALNDKELGRLIADENDTIAYFRIPKIGRASCRDRVEVAGDGG